MPKNLPTKKSVDEWTARSRERRAQAKAMAAVGDMDGLKALIDSMDEFEAYTRKALGLPDA